VHKEKQRQKAEAEAESTEIEDNLSLSEIIARKYARTVHQIRTPEEAAKVLVKDTQEFDVNSQAYAEGSKEEQEAAQKKLENIETNLASKWKDIGEVKQRLWQKLHSEVSPDLQKRIDEQMDKAQNKPDAPSQLQTKASLEQQKDNDQKQKKEKDNLLAYLKK